MPTIRQQEDKLCRLRIRAEHWPFMITKLAAIRCFVFLYGYCFAWCTPQPWLICPCRTTNDKWRSLVAEVDNERFWTMEELVQWFSMSYLFKQRWINFLKIITKLLYTRSINRWKVRCTMQAGRPKEDVTDGWLSLWIYWRKVWSCMNIWEVSKSIGKLLGIWYWRSFHFHLPKIMQKSKNSMLRCQ